MELALVMAGGLKVTVILQLAIIPKYGSSKVLNNPNTTNLLLSCISHSFKKGIKYLFTAPVVHIQVYVCVYLKITFMFSKDSFKKYFLIMKVRNLFFSYFFKI